MRNAPVAREGDQAFMGVDAATAAEKLPAGLAAAGANVRFRSKRARGRLESRLTGLMAEEFWPYVGVTNFGEGSSGSDWLVGSVTDTTLTVSGNRLYTGAPSPHQYVTTDHVVRFESGRVMAITEAPKYGAITAFSDAGGGEVGVASVNTLVPGDLVSIYGTTNYDGRYTVVAADANNFSITATWVSNDAAGEWVADTWEVAPLAFFAASASGNFKVVSDVSGSAAYSVINQAGELAMDSGIFSDPNGYEYGLVATLTGVWAFRDYERPFEISVPGGIPGGYVDFVQCFDRLLLLRGDDLPVLEYDGSNSNAFASIADTTTGSYTSPIPNARLGIFIKDRVFVVSGRDTIYHSDIGVYTRYKEFESGFRVNQGTADSITCLYPYGDEAFLVGFSRSIYLVYNIRGDLSDMSVKLISANVGIAGRRAICTTGDDVWFADVRGDIWPLSRVDETRQAVGGMPVSWPIRPLMDSYGYHKPETIRMIGHGDEVLVAFSGRDAQTRELDSGVTLTYPNLVAVYDKVTGHWAGIDSYAYMEHAGWIYTRYGSRNQLLFVGKYGGIYQYYSESGESAWSVTTRGYALDAAATEQPVRLALSWSSQGADLTIEAVRDGAGTAVALESNLTRNRLKYLGHGVADFDGENGSNDFDAPDREDYSVVLSDAANGMHLTDDGEYTNLEQSFVECYDVDGVHEYLQVVFRNNVSDSRASLRAVRLDAVRGNDDFGQQ